MTDRCASECLKVVQYSLGRKRRTFGHGYPAGYQSIGIDGQVYYGQRDSFKRVATFAYDFRGKKVLDLGCNIGGVLHALWPRIGYGIGVGVDSNAKCINAAWMIRELCSHAGLYFYTFDIRKEPLDFLLNFTMGGDYDVVLCLSLALWVGNWREVVQWCHPRDLIYESNGSEAFQSEQERFLQGVYSDVIRMTERSDDDARLDPAAKMRRTYLCTDIQDGSVAIPRRQE